MQKYEISDINGSSNPLLLNWTIPDPIRVKCSVSYILEFRIIHVHVQRLRERFRSRIAYLTFYRFDDTKQL